MTTNETTFRDILETALNTPGTISAAYTAFHGYSIGNQILAMMQCAAREITPGPIATFNGWKNKGRFVMKGQKAIVLCMPITCKRKAETEADQDAAFTRFVYRPNWFTLAQTDGSEYVPAALPDWNAERALSALDITRETFSHLDGNVQGYARDRVVAVSPIAAHPDKTMFHELAHVVLGHTTETAGSPLSDSEVTPRSLREVEAESVAMICCEALRMSGADDARGYIQHWNAHRGNDAIPERSAQRIFKAANTILTAGRPAAEADAAE